MDTKVTPGEIVVMAAGALGLIAAFLPFYKNGESSNSFDEGLFPVATLIAIFAVVAGVLVVLTKFANVQITNLLGFGFVPLLVVFGFFSAILAVAFLIAPRDFAGTGEFDFGFGYYLLLIAGLGSVVGAIIMRNERQA
ncbi:MAG: hypothetical protein ACT4PI_01760 [Actinomycetota bacterium]